jgi:hypothetical protein
MDNLKTKKLRRLLLALIVASLLLSTMAQAQPHSRHSVEASSVSGGRYRLTPLVWYACGSASGGDYRLLGPAAPTGRGSGCCCTFLPLTARQN